MRYPLLAALVASALSCANHPPAPAATMPIAPKPPTAAPARSRADGYVTSTIALPGAPAGGILIDFLLYDPRTQAVWVPAGNTGSVDVLDTTTGKLARIEGFPTKEIERNGTKRTVGPSSVTLGDHGTYVGNRGDSTICAIDETKLVKGSCGALDSMPDGIVYVATTKEVWVTTPRDKSIRILDANTLVQKAKLSFDGEPEGYAVDPVRGRFYTNLEDKDETLAIDLATHKTVATWHPSCGEAGPHGVRLDAEAGLLFIACSTKIETMNVGKDGAIVGSVDTGDGVDDLDYDKASHRVYAGAAKAGTLTIAAVDAKGALSVNAVVPTADGARNGVVDDSGKVYLAHGKGSELVVVEPPHHVR